MRNGERKGGKSGKGKLEEFYPIEVHLSEFVFVFFWFFVCLFRQNECNLLVPSSPV